MRCVSKPSQPAFLEVWFGLAFNIVAFGFGERSQNLCAHANQHFDQKRVLTHVARPLKRPHLACPPRRWKSPTPCTNLLAYQNGPLTGKRKSQLSGSRRHLLAPRYCPIATNTWQGGPLFVWIGCRPRTCIGYEHYHSMSTITATYLGCKTSTCRIWLLPHSFDPT